MDDPTHGNYWRREIELLASGLPGRLPPGLEPPRCHGWSELPEQAAWMWFEDLGDLGAAAWDEE